MILVLMLMPVTGFDRYRNLAFTKKNDKKLNEEKGLPTINRSRVLDCVGILWPGYVEVPVDCEYCLASLQKRPPV
jgi:hypothetical protein